jgi:hypothetical protein
MAERTDMVMFAPVGQRVKDGCESSASGGTDFGLLKQHLAHRW